jgi:hypothetical protein
MSMIFAVETSSTFFKVSTITLWIFILIFWCLRQMVKVWTVITLL